MICRYCGNSLSENARFCGACGRTLGVSQPVVVVPPKQPMSAFKKSVILVSLAVFGVAGFFAYRWYNRPEGRYLQDNSGLYRFPQGNKMGYVNKSGKMVIQAQFDEAKDFSEKFAPVRVGDKFGYIDTNGKMVVTPQFSDASPFRYGRAMVKICCGRYTEKHYDDHYGFIDTAGKLIGTDQYSDAGHFSGNRFNPLAPVVYQGKVGFIEKSGNFAIPATFDATDDLYGFSEGLAAVASNGKWGYIDTSGKWVIHPQFDHAGYFSEGLASVVISGKSGTAGFIDTAGKFVINPQFDTAFFFVNGLSPVRVGDKWKFIDTKGNFMGDDFYKTINWDEGEGMWAVLTENGWGYVQGGKLVIPPAYDYAGKFLGGLGPVTIGGINAYIDKSGKFVGDPFIGHSILPASEVREIWQGDEHTPPNLQNHIQFMLIRQGNKISGYQIESSQDAVRYGARVAITGEVHPDGSVQISNNFGSVWRGRFAAPVLIVGDIPPSQEQTASRNESDAVRSTFRLQFIRTATAEEGSLLTSPTPPDLGEPSELSKPMEAANSNGSQSTANASSAQINALLAGAQRAFAAGDYSGALQSCNAALQLDPHNAMALQLQAKIRHTQSILNQN